MNNKNNKFERNRDVLFKDASNFLLKMQVLFIFIIFCIQMHSQNDGLNSLFVKIGNNKGITLNYDSDPTVSEAIKKISNYSTSEISPFLNHENPIIAAYAFLILKDRTNFNIQDEIREISHSAKMVYLKEWEENVYIGEFWIRVMFYWDVNKKKSSNTTLRSTIISTIELVRHK